MPPNPSQSSFIPKRGADRAKRKKPAKRIFLFSLIAYSLVFASLLASGASYLYKNYTTSLLQNEVSLLNSEINTFSVSDLSVVSEFNLTLQRAKNRIENTASVVAALEAIERATAQPIQITTLAVERFDDKYMLLVAEITAQSFDSALFQRNLLNADQYLFSEVSIDDVSIVSAAEEENSVVNNISLVGQPVTFTATMRVPIDSLAYLNTQSETSVPVTSDNQAAL